MGQSWSQTVVAELIAEFGPLADPQRAAGMRAYMKDVAPFLGIAAPIRRRAQRAVWRSVPAPGSGDDVLTAATDLAGLPEREFAYAGAESVGRYLAAVPGQALDSQIRTLLLTAPWWDTVDLWGTQVITPLVAREPELIAVMWRWNRSGDPWLIRASIQHQRGLGPATDVGLLLDLCRPHVGDATFWVSKAIGWALRDTCRIDAPAVAEFVADHPTLRSVARREADKGLRRAGLSPR